MEAASGFDMLDRLRITNSKLQRQWQTMLYVELVLREIKRKASTMSGIWENQWAGSSCTKKDKNLCAYVPSPRTSAMCTHSVLDEQRHKNALRPEAMKENPEDTISLTGLGALDELTFSVFKLHMGFIE
ncbi:hypothetical protein M758_UG151100 [Ceratodon purpureus]|nr:hypothetical protein M758_UG151100 [Ceratodon purpureus]